MQRAIERLRPRRRRILSSASILGALVLCAAPGPALGFVPVKSNTAIVVTPSAPGTVIYSGRIVTKAPDKGNVPADVRRRAARKCVRGRKVTISSEKDALIGSTFSDKKGNWSLTGSKPYPPGDSVSVFIARAIRGDVLCGVRRTADSVPIP